MENVVTLIYTRLLNGNVLTDVLLQLTAKQYYHTQQHARVNGCGCVAQNHSTDVKTVCGFMYNEKKVC